MRTFRLGLLSAMLAALWGIATAQGAQPRAIAFKIDAQPVDYALKAFAGQSGLQVLFHVEGAAIPPGLKSPSIDGTFTPEAALDQLLANTGLRYEFINDRTVTIRPRNLGTSQTAAEPDLRLVQSEAGSGREIPPQADRSSSPASANVTEISEIIVSAQKRDERLQDVPVPVTAISAEALVDSNQLRLQDYYTKVPGLNLTMLGDVGNPLISIRGVTTGGYVNPTVGTVVDDIPFGASNGATLTGNIVLAPDFDPSELSRIEVLRGPQGTLYGASSMGGLLKYVTVDPSTDGFSGRMQVGTNSVHKGDELGYNALGSVNIPFGDRFAVRASGSVRRDAGYIDNLQAGQDGVNSTDRQSARVGALWQPVDNLSVKLSALYQRAKQDGTSEVHLQPGIGDLQQRSLIDSGTYDQKLQAYSATLTAKLGRAELKSLTGYNISELHTSADVTTSLAAQTQTRFGVGSAVQNTNPKNSKFTQEFRLSTPMGDRIDWLLGAFYTHESFVGPSDIFAIDTATGAFAGNWYHQHVAGEYNDYAAFADVTFQLTDRFDVQVGARASRIDLTNGPTSSEGPFNIVFSGIPSGVTALAELEAKDTPFTYLLTPRLRISPDLMVYARLASGYRAGGTNSIVAQNAGLPAQFDADTTQTYEIGFKGNAFDRALSFDGSIYYIDWQDVQVQVRSATNVVLTYTQNAAAAKSEGIELSLELRPLEGMTISAWGAYNNAVLTEVPANITLAARTGDRLPYSARQSGYLAVDQEFPMGNMTGFAGVSLSYVGDRKGRYFTVPQGTFPGYAQTDLRAGLTFGSWTINTYLNNVMDKRGVLRGGRDSNLSRLYAFNYIQPRTIGLSLAKTFR